MVYLLLAARWLLGLVLLASGVGKLADRGRVRSAVARYRLLPPIFVAPVAAVLPALELVLALALVLGMWPSVAGAVAAALLLAFGGVIAWNLLRGRRFECGCGLAEGALISWPIVCRDGILALVAAGVALGPSDALALSTGPLLAPTAVLPAASRLITVPMIVLLVAACARLEAARLRTQGVSRSPQSRADRKTARTRRLPSGLYGGAR